MKFGITAALLLTLPFAAGAQPPPLRGLGIDERLDGPSLFALTGEEASRHLFVQLIVPRSMVEPQPGEYAFGALDERMSLLEGAAILMALEGMPDTAEAGEAWRGYVLAVAERYSERVRGFVLGKPLGNATPPPVATYAYLVKVAAVQIRSLRPDLLLIEGDGRSREPEWLETLYQEEIAPYFDGMAVPAGVDVPRERFDEKLRELRSAMDRYDPTAQIVVAGVALGGDANDALRRIVVDGVSNLAAGSALSTFSGNHASLRGLADVASRLSPILADRVVALDDRGDASLTLDTEGRFPQNVHHRLLFNADSGSTLLVYWADAPTASGEAIVVSLRSFLSQAPTLSDPGRDGPLPILGFLYDAESSLARARVPLSDRPLVLEFAAPVAGATVTASPGLQVSEILARHQQAEARQSNLLVRYYASVRDEIHFRPTPIDSFDVIIQSRFYADRDGSEWEELSFSLNGARWGSDRPAFPLLQPEKVLSLPLDLRLDDDYEYELVGRETLVDRDCYVVRFEPIAEGRSLYSGRVWIDSLSFAKLKVEAVQKELSAPVVSNAEVYTYRPQAVIDATPIYLLTELSSKQLVLIAGRNLLVEKESRFYDFQVNSQDFESLRQAARASDHIMLRDTEDGLRYFVKKGGERQVSDELTRSAKALALGTTIDPSFDFPLPIVGLNYLDFDFLDRSAQFALLFGGVFALGNIQRSGLLGGDFDASLDFFGIAVQSNDVVFDQEGEIEGESLRALPASLGINLGWQATDFQKLSARYDLRYDHYGRDETTSEDFVTPKSTFTNGFTLGYELRKRGYSLLGSGSYGRRADWEPWGDVLGFEPDTQSYWRYRWVLGKDFFFKTFHKIHVDAGWFGGDRLDRFTKYQFGLFDETRVRGVPSTAVRFAELVLARASYSFNVFDQFRVEVFYDQGWGDDRDQGLEHVRFSGLGLGLNLRGPRHTIIRLDLGKGFLPEELRGAGTVVMQFLILKPL